MGKSSRPTSTDRQAKIQAAAKATKPGPNRAVIAAVVAILAIVGVVGAVVYQSVSRTNEITAGGTAVPAGTTMGAGYTLAGGTAPAAGAPTVDIWEDFQCPACADFEKTVGAEVATLAASGKAKVVYHVKNFLDPRSADKASTRAGVAAFCAADAGKFAEYHKIVFANQPATEGDGWTTAQLRGFAEQAGLTGAALTTWDECTKAGKYTAYINAVDEQSAKDGITGTPTLRINGKDLTDAERTAMYTTSGSLTKLVEAATTK